MPRKAEFVLPTVDTCHWRRAEQGRHVCELLAELVGRESAAVPPDACAACCQSFPASQRLLNPVVASLLFRAASELAKQGGSADCSPEQAAQLQQFARRWLNIQHPAGSTLIPARAQTTCGWLGEPLDPSASHASESGEAVVYVCRHRRHRQTTAEGCRLCRDWVVQPPRSRFLTLNELIPPPQQRCGPAVRRWAVGVTSSPRRESTLEWTLDSIVRAGWSEPHVFLDGTSRLPPRYRHVPLSWREDGLGAWPAWYFALAELVLKYSQADAYLLLQDDVALADRESLRDYLESALWPGEQPGIVSLFYSGSSPRAGWFDAAGQWHFSAQALLLSPGVARALLSDADIMRTVLAAAGGQHIPVPEMVHRWALRTGVSVWYANPSLAQHIGNTSTIWMDAAIVAGRKAVWFSGSAETEFASGETLADFPEEAFPCPEQHRDAYLADVASGRARMRDSSAVICTLVEDARRQLPRLAARIERLGEMFKDYRILVGELPSQDATVEYLQDWQASNPRLEILTVNRGTARGAQPPPGLDRQRAAAELRERVRLRIAEQFSSFEATIVVDVQLAGGWSYEGIAHTFAQNDWDAVGPTGPQKFHTRRSTYEAASSYDNGQRDSLSSEARLRGGPLVPMTPCFGGLIVYRTACMLVGTYVGDSPASWDPAERCEQERFHQSLRRSGRSRLFINPSQIALADWHLT